MAGRARRRRRRFTPRRWLPFVALTALVVGAVVLDAPESSVAPEQLDASLDVTALPTVARPDALSTAFYCAGGTARGEDGPAELSIVLANDAPTGATAEVTLVGPDGAQEQTALEVPAQGRARLRASEVIDAEWVAALVVVEGGRVGVDREVTGPLGFDSSPCATDAADRWFVPSGTTVRGSELYLSLFNPFPDTASVDITLATDSGPRTPRALRRLAVAGRTVRVVRIGELVTDRTEIAATVRAQAGRVIVDRIQTHDGTGDPITTTVGDVEVTTPAPKGLVSTTASPVRAPRWVLPGARVAEGVRTQVGIFNPSSVEARVDVKVRYQDQALQAELAPVELTIRAHEQAVVDLSTIPGLLAGEDLWVDVRSLDGVPVVAERTTAFGDPSPRQGVATTLGSPFGADRWMITQAGATRVRSGTVQVVNPNAADVAVRVYALEAGDRRELTSAAVTIPGEDRASLVLDDAGAAATIVVEADDQVVVGWSLSELDGTGVAIAPALAFPETVVSLPAYR